MSRSESWPQAVMAQRTEVDVFLVSSLQLVSAHCCGHSVPSALPIQPGACNDEQAWCDRTGHLMKGMMTGVLAQLMSVHSAS